MMKTLFNSLIAVCLIHGLSACHAPAKPAKSPDSAGESNPHEAEALDGVKDPEEPGKGYEQEDDSL